MDIIKQLENNHDDLEKNWQNAVSYFASAMDACEHDVEEEKEMSNEWTVTTDEDSNEEGNRYDNIISYLLLQMLSLCNCIR